MVSPAANSTVSLSSLPDEVLVEVLPNLPFDALLKMRITDKRFYGLISGTPVTLLRAMDISRDPRIAFLGAKTLGKVESFVAKFLEITGMDKWEMHRWSWKDLLWDSGYTLGEIMDLDGIIANPSGNVRSLDINQLYHRLQFFNTYTRLNEFDFDHFYPEATSNKDFVLAVMVRRGSALKAVDPSLKKDPEVARAAVSQNGLALQHVDFSSMTPSEIIEISIAAVSQNGLALEHVDPQLKPYLDIVLPAVSQNGLALKLADPSFHLDSETVARTAAVQNLNAIEIATFRVQRILKKDKSLFLEHLQKKEPYFERMHYVSTLTTKDDPSVSQVVNDAVESFGHFADSSLKEDKSYVLDLIRVTRGHIFPHIDPSLQDDEEVAKAALYGHRGAFRSLSPRLKEKFKKDKSLVLELTKQNPSYFEIADPLLRKDKPFVLELIKLTRGRVYPYISEKLTRGRVYPYISEYFTKDNNHSALFKYDSDIIEAVHAERPWHFENTNSRLHQELIREREARLKDPKSYKFDLKDMDPFFLDDENIVKMACLETRPPDSLDHPLRSISIASPRLHKKLSKDKSFVLDVFKKHKNTDGHERLLDFRIRRFFDWLDDSLKMDEKVALAAVFACRSLFRDLDLTLQRNEEILRIVDPKLAQQVARARATEEAQAAVDLPAMSTFDVPLSMIDRFL